MVTVGVVIVTPNYLIRIESIVRGGIEGSGDRGSLEARQELLKESVKLMVRHPIFGVGPGNFSSYTLTWRVAHNTYTELGAEAGVPAVFLFLLLLGLTLRKIRRVRKLPGYESSEDIRLWASALWAAMAAYMAGAMFASTEYNLFPYFMVGYICAVYQIASPQGVSTSPQDETSSGGKGKWKWWKTRAGTGLESLTTSWLSCAAWSVTTGWISVLMDSYVPAVETSIPR